MRSHHVTAFFAQPISHILHHNSDPIVSQMNPDHTIIPILSGEDQNIFYDTFPNNKVLHFDIDQLNNTEILNAVNQAIVDEPMSNLVVMIPKNTPTDEVQLLVDEFRIGFDLQSSIN